MLFSVQLSTKELWGIVTSFILQHSFFPDVSCSSLSCCAGERALIAHKFLIKKQYWAKPKWHFANFIVYVTAFSTSIYNLFLIYRPVTLLIFLFPSSPLQGEVSDYQSVFRHGFSQQRHRAQLDPQRVEDGRSPLSPSPPVVWGGLHQSCWSAQCQKGLTWGWAGHTVGMCLPRHASKSWYRIRLGQWGHLTAVQRQAAF